MKFFARSVYGGFLALAWTAGAAHAHIAAVNLQTPYAVAGKAYELILTIPHGCRYMKVTGEAAEADSYKIEMDIPAGFTGVRPVVEGVFGRPLLTRGSDGAVAKIMWTKTTTFDSPTDDQSYRIGLRGTTPNAPFTTIQFATKQFCKDPLGGADLVIDWSSYGMPPSNESPMVKVFPVRAPGWNKFSVAPTSEKHTPAEVTTLLKDFFSEAQIVWLMAGTNTGNGAWSANSNTAIKIKTLASKDPMSYDIAASTNVMIHAADVIWAKF